MNQYSLRSLFLTSVVAVTALGCVLRFIPPSVAEANDLQFSPKMNEPEMLKCKRVHPRFSVCGDTNFKNRVVGGFGIHFSVVNPNGQLTAVGRSHTITQQNQSCNSLMDEGFVPYEIRRKAIAVCKDMIQEHQADASTFPQ